GRHLWFFYDSNHRVIQVDAYSGTGGTYSITTYSYTGAPGQLGNTVDTDPDGNATTYSYSQPSLPLVVTGTKDAAGFTTSTSWTGDSEVSSFTNQAGGPSNYTYNANMGPNGDESLTATADPSGATTGAAYSSTSCASGVTAKYLPSTTTNNVGQLSSLCYDTAGDLTSATDPAGDIATVAYNPNGTPATSTTPLQAAAGVYTGYSWDPANQLTLALPSNQVGPETATAYDNFGYVLTTANLASLRATSVARDAMGRVTASTSTGAGGNLSITYHYDADGYPTSEVDPGGTTTFTYDGMGNQVAETAPGGVNDTYSYDLASNMVSVTDAAGTTSYHYNNRELLDQVTEPSGRIDVVGYNSLGEVTDVWTNAGSAVSYTGNTVNPPASFATHRHATYNTSGGVTELRNTLSSSDSNVFSDVSYGYTTATGCANTPSGMATDQIRFEYDAVSTLESAFCYDQAGRLSVANLEGTVTTYGYDADGNLSSGSLGTFTHNTADQITNSGFSFDADGNLTATPTLTLAYNGADQTTSVTPSGQSATSLAYSGAGQDLRLSSTGPSGTTTFANGALGIESQASTSGGTTKFVTFPDGSPICESTPTGDYYYVTDIMGSVIGLVTPSGTARAKYAYTPYGTQTATGLNGVLPSNPYGFDGGYIDTTGLVHFGLRYYDPVTGQWTQLDPSGSDAGYVFAEDDPIDLADPSGAGPSNPDPS
ncbi:MAG: RHS repeat-associated core domain-containing protein, partial [Acidimicrobiales bacterium]